MSGVPCSPINTLAQLLDHPHTKASDMIVDYDHPAVGPVTSVGQPFTLDGERRTPGTAPPLHGQHTDEVLGEMGLDRAAIDKLRASKVIA